MHDLPNIDDAWIGTLLDGRFEVCALLGKGGMGAIYRCVDTVTGRQVAIKITLDELQTDDEVMTRFEREIQASKDIDHPNVVRVLGHGRTEAGTPYFAMELLSGVPLDELLEDAPLPSDQVAHIGAQIARGLHAAHLRGIIHRDLKPENVVLGPQGQVKVFDFGLALLRKPGETETPRLTELDKRIGTPLYMSPEYIEMGQVDARSDLYSLGVLLYEAATGYVPHTGPPYQVMHKHATQAPKPIDERVPGKHPQWLIDAIDALLAKNPEDRPQTGEQAAAQLTHVPSVNSVAPAAMRTVSTPQLQTSTPPRVAAGLVGTAVALSPKSAPRAWQVPHLWMPLILLAALSWHGISLGLAAGRPSPDAIGRDLTPAYYGVQVAASGGSAYDVGAAIDLARADRDRSRVRRTFASPASLAAVFWARSLNLEAAWSTWFGVQTGLFMLGLAGLVRSWRSLGRTPLLALGFLLAAGSFLSAGLVSGAGLFAPFAAAVFALAMPTGPAASALLGLAIALSPVHLVLGAFWALSHRWRDLLIAVGVALALTLLAALPLGLPTIVAYFADVLPSTLTGSYKGLGLRLDALSNHSIAHWMALAFPGSSGQHLSTPALFGVYGVGLSLLGTALWTIRSPTQDPWTRVSRQALMLATVGLIGPYVLHTDLLWSLPAMALCAAGLATGRLTSSAAVPLGVALAVLCYPEAILREFNVTVILPALPVLAGPVQALRLASLLGVWVAILSMSRPRAHDPG